MLDMYVLGIVKGSFESTIRNVDNERSILSSPDALYDAKRV